MPTLIRRSLFAVSLCLNIAFVIFWAVRATPDMFSGQSAVSVPGGGSVSAVFNGLEVSPEERKKLTVLGAEFAEEARATRRAVRAERERLLDLLAAESLDRPAIEAAQQEILAGQERMKNAVVDLLIKARDDLSREQYLTLIAAIRARSAFFGSGQEGRMHGRGVGPAMTQE